MAPGAVHAGAHRSFTVPVNVWVEGSRVHVEMHACNKRNWPFCNRLEALLIRASKHINHAAKCGFEIHHISARAFLDTESLVWGFFFFAFSMSVGKADFLQSAI